MIVEFSDDVENDPNKEYGYSRIFLWSERKENSRYFFQNDSPIWEIENIGSVDSARGRYESLNQLVITESDIERNDEYLFSTSSYDSLTELHHIKIKHIFIKRLLISLVKIILPSDIPWLKSLKIIKFFIF